jgi:hypothetical protein
LPTSGCVWDSVAAMHVNVARPTTADKIVFLIFMIQC